MVDFHIICNTIARWLVETGPEAPAWPEENWQAFQLAARMHGVAPLLYEKLRQADSLDPTIRDWLAGQYQHNVARLARMQAELKAILGSFYAGGVPLIPLKGSVLAAAYYPEAGLRPMADLDLLIRPEDLVAATHLLGELGYEPEVTHWKHVEFSRPDNRRVVSTEVEHPDNPRRLEVHLHCRETFGGPTVDLTELMWQRAVRRTLLGESTLLVDADILWLHLLVHATYHAWQGRGRLLHLLDLAQVRPHLKQPLPLLNSIDARYTYPALELLHRFFPGRPDVVLLASQHGRVSASFRRWTHSLNLVNMSYLNPNPAGLYLLKALRFTGGRPGEVLQAFRFAFLPGLAEIALDHPRLARSKAPWLAYFLLPLDWVKRLK